MSAQTYREPSVMAFAYGGNSRGYKAGVPRQKLLIIYVGGLHSIFLNKMTRCFVVQGMARAQTGLADVDG
jgi:hypothetical protein